MVLEVWANKLRSPLADAPAIWAHAVTLTFHLLASLPEPGSSIREPPTASAPCRLHVLRTAGEQAEPGGHRGVQLRVLQGVHLQQMQPRCRVRRST